MAGKALALGGFVVGSLILQRALTRDKQAASALLDPADSTATALASPAAPVRRPLATRRSAAVRQKAQNSRQLVLRALCQALLAAGLALACALYYSPLLGAAVAAASSAALVVTTVRAARSRQARRRPLARLTASLAAPQPAAGAPFARPGRPTAAVQDLTGEWVKDKQQSDSMDEASQLLRLNGLMRAAVGLIKGLHITQTTEAFQMAIVSGILWFKVTEQYPLSGEARQYKRRDFRRGKHTGHAEVSERGGVRLRFQWPEPLGGSGTDHFYCPSPGLLYVDSLLTVGGQSVKYRTVYRKQR